MCKVSVIIPCYNSSEYIGKCLRSFERQTFKEFEIIVVDDCSKDDTVEVVLNHINTSALSIKLLCNEVNRGPSYSRFNGITHAAGEYVSFCDSDDWYEPDYLMFMYQKSQEEDADIVIADYYIVSSQGQKRERKIGIQRTLSSAEALTINVDSMCIMLCRKQLFKGLAFPDIRNGEDMAVIPALLSRANRVGFVDECLYNYQYRENSASNSSNDKVVNSMILSFQYVEDSLAKKYREEIEYIGIRNLIYGALLNLFKYSKSNERADQILYDFVRKYPNWNRNKYLDKMPAYKRVFVKAAYGRHYFILRLLARLHTVLAG